MDMVRDETLDNRVGYASLLRDTLSIRAARKGGLKYIHDLVAEVEAWYDLDADPYEQRPLTTLTDDGKRLVEHVSRMATRGAHGFHLLITCGDGADHVIEGTISTGAMGQFQLRYHDWKSHAEKEGSVLRFSVKTKDSMDAYQKLDVWHEQHAEQDNAHLYVETGPGVPIEVKIRVDGEPIGDAISFVGADVTPSSLADAVLNPLEILANPDAFDPAALPRRFAVYAWYVADVETLSVEELDAETVEALRGLGYLD